MFDDRIQAGQLLARKLKRYKDSRPVILGLPRGGVPVAAEVADALDAPLDIIVVRKLGLPGRPEFAMGAIGESDISYIDWPVVSSFGVSASQLTASIERERAELRRRTALYRGERPRVDIEGRMVIIVDDGIATGSTVRAAVRVARALGARSVIVATPVAPEDTVQQLRAITESVVVLETPSPFYAVGEAYAEFGQTRDHDVIELLGRARDSLVDPAA